MCINIVSFLFIIMAVQISLYHTGKYMVHPLQKITSYATATLGMLVVISGDKKHWTSYRSFFSTSGTYGMEHTL